VLVVWFPDRDDERAGVITTIFMNEDLVYRPTSAATADELAAQLCNIRTCTRRVTDDLSMRQLMGPMLPIVNPILWEIGHVGWFHEYWTLRHAHGEAPILDRADRLWNSSTVAHATRWDLDLPDRNGVFGYMADVLGRQLDRLGGGIELPACYFYDLSIRHEDMHVEALVYTRQTLGYARPERLGDPASHRAGAWRGDVEVPGGRWRLGSTAADGFIFDNEKWAHEVDIAPFRIAKAPVTNAEFAAFVDDGGYRRREFWSAAGWAWRERVALMHANQQERSQELEQRLNRSLKGFTVQSSDIQQLDQLQQNLVLTFKFSTPGYAQVRDPLMLVRARVMGEKGMPLERKPRRFPFQFEGTSRETDVYEIDLPKEYVVDDVPEPVNVDMGFAMYQSKVEVVGSKLRYSREFVQRNVLIPPDRTEDLRKLEGIIGADEVASVVLKRAQ